MFIGYIELEQENYSEAISVFYESLKVRGRNGHSPSFCIQTYDCCFAQIQRVLLEADNKLILSTLDNIGYALCMQLDFEKARKV